MPYPIINDVARAQVVMQRSTGIPSDVFVNNFYFLTSLTENVEDSVPAMTNMLNAFYNNPVAPAVEAVSDYLNPAITSVTYKFYDLGGQPPRYPVVEPVAASWVGQGGAALPSEVACVLSFRGGNGPRRRGRVYIGPLSQSAAVVAAGQARPAPAFRLALAEAARDMRNSSENPTWTVVSPTAAAHYPVTDGWVDDAWDTQRSRGLDPSTRYTWDSSGVTGA